MSFVKVGSRVPRLAGHAALAHHRLAKAIMPDLETVMEFSFPTPFGAYRR
jgi:hypothetical protein